MIRRPPSSPLFPYPTLSRSGVVLQERQRLVRLLVGRVVRREVLLAHRDELVLQVEPAGGVLEQPDGADVAALVPDLDHHRSEEHTSELQSQSNIVCRLLLEK